MTRPVECFVSVVAPLRNDGATVQEFMREVVGVLRRTYANYELVLVDDGSRDDSVARATALLEELECVRLIRLSRSFGEEAAISAGLDSVIGDFVVVMLPHSDPPEAIPDLVAQAQEGPEILFGVRDDEGDPAWMRAGRRLFYVYCRRLLRLDLPTNTSQFRVLSRQAVNAMLQVKDRHRYLRVVSAHVGYASRAFAYRPLNRGGKRRTRSVPEALNLGLDLALSSSRRPLRAVSWAGAAFAFLWLAYGVAAAALPALPSPANGFLSLQLSSLFLVLFVVLAVLCEYVAHVLVEAQARPLYHALEERTSGRLIVDPERRNVVADSMAAPRASVEPTRAGAGPIFPSA